MSVTGVKEKNKITLLSLDASEVVEVVEHQLTYLIVVTVF